MRKHVSLHFVVHHIQLLSCHTTILLELARTEPYTITSCCSPHASLPPLFSSVTTERPTGPATMQPPLPNEQRMVSHSTHVVQFQRRLFLGP